MDESSAEQQVCVSTSITFVVRKTGPILLVLVGLTGGREGVSEAKYGFILKVLKV